MSTKFKATIEDLYTLPENSKAEIVNGELVLMSPPEIYQAVQQGQSTSAYANTNEAHLRVWHMAITLASS